MATATFYTHITDLTIFACRLTQKAYNSGANVLVWLADEKNLNQFNQALWGFEPTSFVPHEIWSPQQSLPDNSDAVLLCCGTELPVAKLDHAVINLADIYWCDAPYPPTRVLELVSNDLDDLAAARERFKTYREAGFTIEHHDMRKQS